MTKAKAKAKKRRLSKSDHIRRHPGMSVPLLAAKLGVSSSLVYEVRSADKKREARIAKLKRRTEGVAASVLRSERAASGRRPPPDLEGKELEDVFAGRAPVRSLPPWAAPPPEPPAAAQASGASLAALLNGLADADRRFMAFVLEVGIVRAKHLVGVVETRFRELLPSASSGSGT